VSNDIEIRLAIFKPWRLISNPAEFDEIKIDEMHDQEEKDDASGIDHIFGKERSRRFVCDVVTHGPRHPVLYLKNDPQDYMENESCKKDYFENFDHIIGSHEMRSCIKPLTIVLTE
jgi:hypothetical protein